MEEKKIKASLLSVYFYDPLFEIPLVKMLLKTSITPNQVTIVSIILSLLAATLIVVNQEWYLFWAGIFLILRNALDCVDGALAEQKNMQSDLGNQLDVFGDKLNEVLIIGAVTAHYILHKEITSLFSITLIFAIIACLMKKLANPSRKAFLNIKNESTIQRLKVLLYPISFLSRDVLWRFSAIAIGLMFNQIGYGFIGYTVFLFACSIKCLTPYDEWWGEYNLHKFFKRFTPTKDYYT